jgi:hypothetical protein
MNIALIGYGRMGHEIESIAIKRGHVIKLIVDQDNENDLNKTNLNGIDVAIEFSFPSAALIIFVNASRKKFLSCQAPRDGLRNTKRSEKYAIKIRLHLFTLQITV